MWDFSTGFPMAKNTLFCGACGHSNLLYRKWHFFRRYKEGSALPARCDVHMKCTVCSYVMAFGVAMTNEQYESSPYLQSIASDGDVPDSSLIGRRDAVAFLQEASHDMVVR